MDMLQLTDLRNDSAVLGIMLMRVFPFNGRLNGPAVGLPLASKYNEAVSVDLLELGPSVW
jgi:hypothetical protein